ncbi:hypothetical protein FACS189429_1860 [Bacteroidia bacterium]|nr:hypothetical protein FACS189429_1860 [Bacteroidia bacterium]GHV44106.1 hypothetical protein FACS1894180_5000 [Bacteroidia bacterium]
MKYQENITSIIINDYILEFSKINGRKPKAILISDRKEHKKSIQDLPYMASMAYLQNYIQKKENIGAGVFSNVICIYYLDQIGEDKTIFKDVPIKLQKKAEQI